MTQQSDESEPICRHCGEPIFREGRGRWAHEYDVRGHMGPWLYCPPPHTTRPEPRVTLPGGVS